MISRRRFLVGGAALAAAGAGCAVVRTGMGNIYLTDTHSHLHRVALERIVTPESLEGLLGAVADARRDGKALSIAGGRHAMGGQQLGTGAVLLDTTAMRRVLRLDLEAGTVEAEAGIQWPELMDFLTRAQAGRGRPWGIIQKQMGANRLSLGGALAANIHGRGLLLKPFVADVDSFVLVDAGGNLRRCDRRREPELFRLAMGGYGLFGVVASVTLRLAPRRALERTAEMVDGESLLPALERRIASGSLYGHARLATDEHSDDFLRRGVLVCDRPLPDAAALPDPTGSTAAADLEQDYYLAHVDKRRAFEQHARRALAAAGSRHWSDTHQLVPYLDNYHLWLDRRLGARDKATEVMTELIVPRAALAGLLDDARRDLREAGANVIAATVRLVEGEDETFLAWARGPSACVTLELHVVHTPRDLDRAAAAFRRLIDLALRHGGTYHLTYHRFATRAQVEACHPRFAEFLRLKQRYDREDRFQSDWYRHYRGLFADGPAPAARG